MSFTSSSASICSVLENQMRIKILKKQVSAGSLDRKRLIARRRGMLKRFGKGMKGNWAYFPQVSLGPVQRTCLYSARKSKYNQRIAATSVMLLWLEESQVWEVLKGNNREANQEWGFSLSSWFPSCHPKSKSLWLFPRLRNRALQRERERIHIWEANKNSIREEFFLVTYNASVETRWKLF